MSLHRFLRSSLSLALLSLSSSAWSAEALLQLKKGDNIAIVGSGLADRQQHHAWLEALIYKSYPDLDLTIRNFGFAADEVNLHPRSDDVPPIEYFLSMKKGDTTVKPGITYKAGTDFGADVILAYWGFNESFRGPEGLENFKKELGDYLTKQLAANYSGEGAPRVVLLSPVAHENLKSPNFPDGEANNKNLALYTQAMAEVAKAKGVPFIDLFTPSKELYAKAKQPLTMNGVHLNDDGDRALAPVQFKELFGQDAYVTSDPQVAKIRDAVLEKNVQWHHRYRTVDQYNIFGGRSRIAYEGVTNAFILGQELAQRDVKTANRDKLVWAVAKGGTLELKDDNLPTVDLTPPNRKEPVPYMSGEEAIKHLTLPKNCKVELVASEETFPELVNPVQMNFDTKGRLWIAAWPTYPETSPTTKNFDKLLVVDLDPKTGKAAKITTFADGLNCPTGFQFYKDGVLVMQSPDLWWIRDTDGDGKADWRERVLHGLDAADSHHETNSICYEPGGAVYLSDGVFHRTNVETYEGPVRNTNGAIYRYEPLTSKFERHIPYNFANPHGRVFDYWGNDLVTDATGNSNYFGPAFSGHLDTGSHPGMEQFWKRPSRPCPGTTILTSRHFPDDWQGDFLNTNVISIQGIFRAKITEEGSGLKGETLENLVSTDIAKNPNFRPSGITVAPDGSLYFMDWSQMLIGHLQHHLRDPNRDHQHGRLYRITYEGRPLLEPKKIDGQPIAALLELLKEPENDVRLRAKIELSKHDAKQVTEGVKAWANQLDEKDPKFEHNLLEALWVHQWHNVVNLDLLKRVLKSPEPRARAQGVRVLGYWRDRVPNALELLKVAADDDAPRVRLEAVRVASFFREWAAADVALTALKKPMDYYLTYCLTETMKQLKPWWQQAISEGKPLAANNPAGIDYVLGSVSTGDLDKLPKTPVVYTALLTREGVPDDKRAEALDGLSKLEKKAPIETLLAVLKPIMGKGGKPVESLCALLLRQPAAELKAQRAQLISLTAQSSPDSVRRAAQAAIMTGDGALAASFAEASKSATTLTDWLSALSSLQDTALRATAYDLVKPLVTTVPAALQKETGGSEARFVRIELPRKGTLTLAEVQIFSNGQNIATSGKATQSSVSNDGEAKRAIDGKTDGSYNSGTQTHTEENENKPWWEVDLGKNASIDGIVIWNRSEDAALAKRLEGFTLTVLDANRHEVFKKAGNPAPKESVRIELKGDPVGALRRAAIRALISTGKEPAAVFASLSGLVAKNDLLPAALDGIRQLPRSSWTAAQAEPALAGVLKWASSVPEADRTEKDYVAALKVAEQLASVLPADRAAAARKSFEGLSIKTFVIKTVREQLRYDTARLVVEAGKPFEITLINDDAMPHNLAFVTPGTHQAVAESVQTLPPTKLDKKGRAYLVDGDARVLEGTKLLEPGQKETLRMTAPDKEGVYEYVCTFPGHWAIMWGKLVVTTDVAAYLKANPEK
jgi:azurin/glucose/arabinose dehydrogenase